MKVDPRERSLLKVARFIGISIKRRRDKSTGQFGYMLYDMRSSSIIAGADPYPLSLDEVEQFLKEDQDSHGAAGKYFDQDGNSSTRL